jgi:hypothetical protein
MSQASDAWNPAVVCKELCDLTNLVNKKVKWMDGLMDGWMDGPMADLSRRRWWRVAVGGGARRTLRRGLRCGLAAAAGRVQAARHRRHHPFNWTVVGGWSG